MEIFTLECWQIYCGCWENESMTKEDDMPILEKARRHLMTWSKKLLI